MPIRLIAMDLDKTLLRSDKTLSAFSIETLYPLHAAGIRIVIATARTAQHVKSLCDDVEDKLAEEGILPRKKEGQNDGRWAILDYGHVLVHVFHPEERQYYRLERLWDDGLNHVELNFDNDDESKPFLA